MHHQNSSHYIENIEEQGKIGQNNSLLQYQQQRFKYPRARFDPTSLSQQSILNHKIKILRGTASNKVPNKNETQQFFSIIQTQFHGLEYTYEVIIGPFRLKILVLNLLREADSGGDDYNVQELGAGTFGTVSEIKLKEGTSFATKRIPFRFKINPDQGYDYEENKSEEIHLKRCLKEFCFYKILSLLNIGPQVVTSGYDLICFNNCIEFKMELCEPINNSFYEKGIEIQQCSDDLYSRMFMLHSMGMVHRDIKPENILFSPILQQFVLGDFGMVSLLKESYKQKTLTRFMGTPSYCGQQMRALQEGGLGNVNLYLNDFHALKLTLEFLNTNFIPQNSRITSNSLSYNECSNSFFGSTSFEVVQNSANSQAEVATDQSPNPTRNSLATLPTTCSLAPKKYASLINYFQSEIIYEICRAMQRKVLVSKDIINEFILKKYSEYQNQQILTNLYIEIYDIFETNDLVRLLIREWRNSSRHYGPEHYLTVKNLRAIVGQVDEKTALAIKDIEKKIGQVRVYFRSDQMQLAMYSQLKNIKGLVYSFISLLSSRIRIKRDESESNALLAEQKVETAKYYIYCIYSLLPYCSDSITLSNLTARYFNLSQVSKQKTQTKIESTMAYCYGYLMDKGQCSVKTTYWYLIYLLEDIKAANWYDRQALVVDGISRLMKSIESSSDEQKVTFISLVLWMAYYPQFYNTSIQIDKLSDLALQLAQKLIQTSTEQDQDHKVYTLYFAKAKLKSMKKEYDSVIQQCQLILTYHRQNSLTSATDQALVIQVLNLISSIFINQQQYQRAEVYLQQALSLIESGSGSLYRPKYVYNILNNILVLKQRTKQYRQALQQAEDISEFLMKADFPKKEIKLIRNYHICISLSFSIGIDQPGKQRIKHYLTQIAEIMYIFMRDCDVWDQFAGSYVDLIDGAVGHLQLSKTFFIYEALLQLFRSNRKYQTFYRFQHAAACYQLAKYYMRDLHQKLKGLRYLRKYLQIILSQCLPSKLRQIDYQIIYIYSKCLVNNQSNRMAIRFLTHILKYIPQLYSQIKNKCLVLIQQAMQTVASPHNKLYNQLTKNKCKKVREKKFGAVVRSIAKNRFEEKLYSKQLKGLFFVQIQGIEKFSELEEGDLK